MVSNVTDLTSQVNEYGVVVLDVGGYDYQVIQFVNLVGKYYTYSTNDSGAIEGIRNGGISPKLRCTITNGSPLVTTESTATLRAGDTFLGVGIPFGTTILNIVDETSFNLSASATESESNIFVAIFAKNFVGVLTENISTGSTDISITASGSYRVSNPIGKYLVLQMEPPSSSDKCLLFSSKIY